MCRLKITRIMSPTYQDILHYELSCYFLQIMKLDDLAEDPRYAENSKRVQNRVALIDTISKR